MSKKIISLCICIFIASTSLILAKEVYITKSGKVYHSGDCRLIANKDTKAISIEDAESKNMTACKKCIGKLEAKANTKEQLVNSEDAVYATKSGKKYHKQDCPLIKNKETNANSLQDAKTKGLKPCGKCFKEELAKVE